MTEIKKIGSYIYPNKDGYFPEPEQKPLPEKWEQALNTIVSDLKEHFQNKIHSIYLRGSLVKGLPIDNISDVDLMIVINGDFQEAQEMRSNDSLKELKQSWSEQFKFITKFETPIYSAEKVLEGNIDFSILLKLFGVPLLGENILKKFPSLKPGSDVHLHASHCLREITDTLPTLETKEGRNVVNKASWLAKRILRSGMEVSSYVLQRHTRDLYFCYESIVEIWPEHQELAYELLEVAIKQPKKKSDIINIFKKSLEFIEFIQKEKTM
jgi:predicted nucleotidyltransferase